MTVSERPAGWPASGAHPAGAQTEDLAEQLVPLAAELVGTVRDYGPADVAAVLARVPSGRFDALAVVLAAMVDPERRPAELLAWVHAGPPPSRDFEPSSQRMGHLPRRAFDEIAVQRALDGDRVHLRQPERAEAVRRLTARGLPAAQIAEQLDIAQRSVVRIRTRTEPARRTA